MGHTPDGTRTAQTGSCTCGGCFQEIWRPEGESWRWARVACCEAARSCTGLELIAAHTPDLLHYLRSTAQHLPLSTYGYQEGKYAYLSERLAVGQYHSAEEALAHLGRTCRLLSHPASVRRQGHEHQEDADSGEVGARAPCGSDVGSPRSSDSPVPPAAGCAKRLYGSRKAHERRCSYHLRA